MAGMKYRKLRIAWSVVWGILCLLMITLWVRSYWQIEHILWNSPTSCVATSIYPGEVAVEHANDAALMPMGWSHGVFPISGENSTEDGEPKTTFGFAWRTDDGFITVYIP